MRRFWSDFRNTLLSRPWLLTWVGVSAVAAITGPFGTFSGMSLAGRSLYWYIIVAAALVIYHMARLAWPRLFPNLKCFSVSVLVALTIAATMTPLANLVLRPVFQPGTAGALPGGQLFILIFLLTISVEIVGCRVFQRLREEVGAPANVVGPRLLERLPEDNRAEILQLSGRDHQVEVRTVKGVSHIRLRLGDAIAEMEGVDGFCAHRSHWVTHAAVVGNGMDGKRPYLILRDDTKVPVSKKHEAAIRERGLL